MKLDIDKTIEGLEGFGSIEVRDAQMVCKMWRWFRKSFKHYKMHYGMIGDVAVARIINEAEQRFFPYNVRQTVTIEIERKSESLLEDTIDQLRLVPGVKDVRPHDSRY